MKMADEDAVRAVGVNVAQQEPTHFADEIAPEYSRISSSTGSSITTIAAPVERPQLPRIAQPVEIERL